jgi:hypothetical protein
MSREKTARFVELARKELGRFKLQEFITWQSPEEKSPEEEISPEEEEVPHTYTPPKVHDSLAAQIATFQKGEQPDIMPLGDAERLIRMDNPDRESNPMEERTARWEQRKRDHPDLWEMAQEFAKTSSAFPEPSLLEEEYIPDSVRWQSEPHPYWEGIHPCDSEPEVTDNAVLSGLRKKYGRKGTFPAKCCRSTRCQYCRRTTHCGKHCELRPQTWDLTDRAKELYDFLDILPSIRWKPATAFAESYALYLPLIWRRVERLVAFIK